jgi:ribosomal protein L9
MAAFQEKQAQLQAKQLELQLQAEKAQAAEDELQRQQQLREVMSAQTAAFGAAGVSGRSFEAIQTADVGKVARADRLGGLFTSTRELGLRTGIAQERAQARQSGYAARAAQTSGLLSAPLAGLSSYYGMRGMAR